MKKNIIQTEDINVKLELSRQNIAKKIQNGKPGPITRALNNHLKICGIIDPEITSK